MLPGKNIFITALLLFALYSFSVFPQKKLDIVFIGDSITRGAGLKDHTEQAPPIYTSLYLKQQRSIGEVRYSNQGVSGFTTIDFLPLPGSAFEKVVAAANSFNTDKEALLIFSIMLGTNDSAIDGPDGSPVSPLSYRQNLKLICDSLLSDYPQSRIVINCPIWYSPNTHNGSTYLQEGLTRLQSYFPEIDSLVKTYAVTHHGHVFEGDRHGFNYFRKNHLTDMQGEEGKDGVFYLHPNDKGSEALGNFWGRAILSDLN
jgi:lysophospholipase L1-like esterase